MKRRVTAMPKFNDRRIYLNRNMPNDLFYLNACGITYPDKNFYQAKHYHLHYTVQYIMSGKGFICYDGQKYELNAGDIFYLSATRGISYGTDSSDPFTKIWFNGSGKFWEMSYKTFSFDKPFEIIPADNSIMEYFNRVFDVAEITEIQREKGMCAITELFSRVYDIKNGNDTMSDAKPPKKTKATDITVEIKRYIDMHICDEDTLSRIAAHFDISERTVYTKFKNAYGMTPAEYVKSCRLSQGAKMLCESESSVSEIAECIGFSSTSYFCKIFRKQYGMTPAQYQKAQTCGKL